MYRKQKVKLQTNVTIILAFIFVLVFYIYSYSFVLWSLSFHFTSQDSLDHFLQGRSCGHKLAKLYFLWEGLDFHLVYEEHCAWEIFGVLFSPLLTHFLLASRVSDGKSAYKLIEDHLELMLHFSHCFQDLLFIFSSWKFDYNISWCGSLCVHISCSIAYSCLSSNLRSQSLFLCSFLSILLLPLRLPWC